MLPSYSLQLQFYVNVTLLIQLILNTGRKDRCFALIHQYFDSFKNPQDQFSGWIQIMCYINLMLMLSIVSIFPRGFSSALAPRAGSFLVFAPPEAKPGVGGSRGCMNLMALALSVSVHLRTVGWWAVQLQGGRMWGPCRSQGAVTEVHWEAETKAFTQCLTGTKGLRTVGSGSQRKGSFSLDSNFYNISSMAIKIRWLCKSAFVGDRI